MIQNQRQRNLSLRLSPCFRDQLKQMARVEGISLSHFVDMALAEKISRLEQGCLPPAGWSDSAPNERFTAANGARETL
jgi:hypothetical protein